LDWGASIDSDMTTSEKIVLFSTHACRFLQVLVRYAPPQREFTRQVAAVEKLKATNRASLAELDALFAALQHRAFRGKL
jgi:hypothetical protein